MKNVALFSLSQNTKENESLNHKCYKNKANSEVENEVKKNVGENGKT